MLYFPAYHHLYNDEDDDYIGHEEEKHRETNRNRQR